MSILTVVENWDGNLKKTSFEAIAYGKKIAEKLEQKLFVVTFGDTDFEEIKSYGADRILNIPNMNLEETSNIIIARTAADLIKNHEINTIIISNTNLGKSISPLLASILDAGLITNAIDYPNSYNPLTIKCKAFSSKAYAQHESSYQKNIINILPNSIGDIFKKEGEGKFIDPKLDNIIDDGQLKIKSRHKLSGKISLGDANIVVSAGRGLKASDNWDMIEELAELLGAGTACSKPVSDMGWRPHSEHVGQTGLAINPELYIAIGISGAIQHLAGVSSSKNIVVINTDPEAPFFKSANYGIVGDAFDVVPKLIEELKKYKN
jgi:electron transfer flavoprotein alpha subunit